MAAKPYGYCSHCDSNHGRRNAASKDERQAERDERRATEVQALSRDQVCRLSARQLALLVSYEWLHRKVNILHSAQEAYDDHVEEVKEGRLDYKKLGSVMRDAWT